MKKFLSKTISICILLLVILSLINGLYIYQIREHFTPKKAITSVFLGDSHFQNGINDKLIANSINFAESAEALIYSRIKLEYILENSNYIDNVFLSVHNSTFLAKIDTIWISKEDNYLSKFSSFYPLYQKKHFCDWESQIVDYELTRLLHKVVWQSIYSIERQIMIGKLPFLGGYAPNDKTLKVEQIDSTRKTAYKTSSNQIEEFLRIKKLCYKSGVNLILINTPVYKTSGKDKFILNQGISNLFNDVVYWDYSELLDSNIYFADRNHLNPKGAEILSNYINDYLIKLDLQKPPQHFKPK